MTAPTVIHELVRRFEENINSYRSPKYNEAQVRLEFINPLFKALGWDIDNEQGFAEQYKEVIHEDTLEIEGASKAPDYAFRIGGVGSFLSKPKSHLSNLKQIFILRISCGVMRGRQNCRFQC